jgi:cytochrome c-type biogenesis protein CcmH
MMLWALLSAIAVLAVALLLAPLWRSPKRSAARAEYDAQVYRDQLAEVERDAQRGAITADQAQAARTEIARRLLTVSAAQDKASATVTAQAARAASKASRRGIAAFVGVAVPVAAFGVYLIVGSPHLPGRPAAEIRAQLPAQSDADINALVARLGDKLKDRPTDLQGWSLYARSLAGLGRFEEAVAAYRRATTLDPRDAELMSNFAEVQIFAARGTVTPEAAAALRATLALDPKEARARYYMGLAASQTGRTEEALTWWLALEADSAPDAPWRKLLGERIAKLAETDGLTPQQLAERRKQAGGVAQAAPPAAPGPTREDVEAAQSMSGADRTAMIRGMVARLAERLKDQPDDVVGWQRLARSYEVLGEPAKAREAHAQIARLRPDDIDALSGYAGAIARTLPRDAPIPAELTALGERILALDPRHAAALWFTGVARAEAGDPAGARERWTRLLAQLEPGTPQYVEVQKSLDALKKSAPK